MRRPALVIVVLGAAALFFGWHTYRAWTAADGRGEPVPAGAAPALRPEPAADNALREADLAAQVAAIAAKPLFRPDRQPFREAAAAGRNYEAELSRFSLVGVLLQGGTRTGLVLGSAAGRPERWEVGAGDSVPGFKVRAVETDGIVLVADGKEFLLPLYAGGPKGQPGSPLRTEVAPGIPGAPAPATPRSPVPPPNVNIPAAAPSPSNVNVPAAVQFPPPAFPDGGRNQGRPPRVYPPNR